MGSEEKEARLIRLLVSPGYGHAENLLVAYHRLQATYGHEHAVEVLDEVTEGESW